MTDLQDKIANRTAHIAVIGLGYVGLPLATAFAKAGFRTTGIDVKQGKVDAINAGQLAYGLAGVSADQLGKVTVAYEPVWAIGTGKTATPDDAQNAHKAIRNEIRHSFGDAAADAIRIQYGGSVKPSNAVELFAQPDIDGGLIGGASLKAEDFLGIVRAAATGGTC